MKRENIFEAHRSHLYQYLANEAKGNSLLISFTYGPLQVLIGLLVIQIAQWDTSLQWVYALVINPSNITNGKCCGISYQHCGIGHLSEKRYTTLGADRGVTQCKRKTKFVSLLLFV
ncbi:hypothetical protein [Parapedobacter tibetensis]|uniref:hypothetical protein n=1 Tax=Parapedobacter tibetensis TaxID=2972951 RepID=UPI00214DE189|nr:hypothetical protein [Parapedobacter tibetensis]